jgi:N-carbamoylputrescine amidase
MFDGCVMPQIKALKLLPYQNYIVAIICQSEDVDNFALAEPLYSTSFIAFSALAKELGVIIVPFSKKNGWCLSQ